MAAGFIYRQAAAKQLLMESQISAATIPLKQFPVKIIDWTGEDIQTDYPIKQATGSNDYMLRLYRKQNGEWANVYITFCAQPRNMLGHRPDVCFTASGWNLINNNKICLTSSSGTEIGCIKYLFEKPAWPRNEMTVLNYYIFNGKLTDNYKDFSSIKLRRLTNSEEQIRYVAQIQISSSNEDWAKEATEEMTDRILNFFPKEIGR